MTLEQFAKKIGLSTGTVSYALNGKGKVNPATRQRVLTAAREHGFFLNRAAAQLASGASYLIAIEDARGWAAEQACYSILETEFASRVLAAIQYELAAAGYSILLDLPREDAFIGTRLVTQFRSKAIDGAIVLATTTLPAEQLQPICNEGKPLVIISYTADGSDAVLNEQTNLGIISVAVRPGVRDLVTFLVQSGHRAVAYINDHRTPGVFQVFAQECQRAGIQLAHSLAADNSVEGGATAFAELCRLPALPSVIATRTDRIAFGVIREARQRGLAIPGDLSVTGFDDDAASSVIDPPLTTVGIDPARTGQLAARQLLALLGVRAPDRESYHCESKLIVRSSVAPPIGQQAASGWHFKEES